jgi:YidC/Oxa1 family membrane protein insertase
MLMEKRVILAFVLSVVVFVLYTFLSPTEKSPDKGAPKPEEKKAVLTAPVQPAPGEPGAAQPAAKALPATPATSGARAGRDIVVKTKWFEAVFSEQGGALKSLKLTAYKERLHDPALKELLRVESPSEYPLQLTWIKNAQAPSSQILFEADQPSLTLSPDRKQGTLTFRGRSPQGLALTKTFTFSYDSYRFDLDIRVVNGTSQPLDDNLALLLENRFPKIENDPSSTFQGQLAYLDGKYEEKGIGKFEKEVTTTGKIQWGALSDTYFMQAVIPVDNQSIASIKTSRPNPEQLRALFVLPPVNLPVQGEKNLHLALYFGPRDIAVLKPLKLDLEQAVNFGFFDIISKPLLWVLNFFNGFMHNYGWAIIVLTILVKILFWPLTHKSYKSMKDMQKLQPKMAKIREKYKDNREKMNQEMMALYKTYKVNPMGGCLPMVIQIPVFFALYSLLGYAIELRHAPFLLWINDLSAPDRLPIGVMIPYVGNGIPVLTLLMGASMFIQQKMTPTTGDPTQAKLMLFLPVVFTFMFINFASGLVLYWLVNNVLSIGQQYYINKYAN